LTSRQDTSSQRTPALWPDEWDGNGFILVGGIQQPLIDNRLINADLPTLYGKSGHQGVIYRYRAVSTASIAVSLTYTLGKEAREAWQFQAWTELRAAASARHQEDMARLQDERDKLWRLLNGKDTLTLRRLEREELMRLAMQWLLGPDYPVVDQGAGSGERALTMAAACRIANSASKARPPISLFLPGHQRSPVGSQPARHLSSCFHHSTSRARIIAGLFGFLIFSQSRDGPER